MTSLIEQTPKQSDGANQVGSGQCLVPCCLLGIETVFGTQQALSKYVLSLDFVSNPCNFGMNSFSIKASWNYQLLVSKVS